MSAGALGLPRQETVAESSRRQPAWILSILLICGLAYLGLFVDGVLTANRELLQGLTIAPILVALTLPFAFRIARTDQDRSLVGIVVAAVALKLLVGYVRLRVAYGVYGGQTDATIYHNFGVQLAPEFRRFDFSADIGKLTSTGAIRFLTGIVYALFGSSRTVGYFVFAWLGFLGLLLFARAFKIGVPEGDSRRYLIAVMFLPSLLYWPSSIGKEAPMMLALGLCAIGIACLFQGRTSGVLFFGVGLVAVLIVRPHVTVIVFVSFVFAALIRKVPARSYAAPLFRVLGVGVLLALGLFLASQTQSFLDEKLQLGSEATLSSQIAETQSRTTEAGSSFTPVTVDTPLDVPLAFVTVLFRPFPFEVSNLQGMLTAAEGMFTLALIVASWNRVRSAPKLWRTTSYVAFAAGFLLAFVVAFSAFANFGLLARQRVQALPLLLVFIALPRLQDQSADAEPAPTPEAAQTPAQAITGTRRRSRRPEIRRERAPVSSGSSFAPPPRPAS